MKKIVLIGLAVIMALGSLGVGYAMWSDTVTINGPVTTGSLNLSFDYVEPPLVQEAYYNELGQLVFGEYLDKEVADYNVYYTDYEEEGAKQGYQRLVIEIDNAYPCYVLLTTFKLHNIGTIPLHVTDYVITGERQDLLGNWECDLIFMPHPGQGDPYLGGLYEDLNGNGVVDVDEPEVINFHIQNSLPLQLEPCHLEKREIDLHCKQPMEQEKKYIFNVVVNSQQWAE
jgi:predicted ribosomally synthesized peptide with SipW-like signal peptide